MEQPGRLAALTAPVMMIVFLALLSSLRRGEMAAYVSLCYVGTGEGNGGCIILATRSGVEDVDSGRSLEENGELNALIMR